MRSFSYWSVGRKLIACAPFAVGCASGGYNAVVAEDTSTSRREAIGNGAAGTGSVQDSTDPALVPAGFGSMRQDDLSFHVNGPGVLIRALPLEESIIRLLTPDSYKSMRDLKGSNRKATDTIARRFGARHTSVWLVSFYGVEPEARFTPMDLTVTSSGRDFRPYDVVPLTTGFGEQRLRQRETQSALYVFDGDIQLNQSVIVTYQSAKDETWETTLQQIERERALIRACASKSRP